MALKFSAEDEAFSADVRDYLRANLPEELASKVRLNQRLERQDYIDWQNILAARNWYAIGWPEEFGGPGLTQTLETPEVLVGAGVKYIGDWVYDDEPTVIRTAKGPLVTLPYTVEINDITMMIVQHHESDHLARRAIDQFERLHAEGEHRAKIMALAIHPYIRGQPHRIKYLEAIYDHVRRFEGVLHWNGAEILDWYLSIRKDAAAGVAA